MQNCARVHMDMNANEKQEDRMDINMQNENKNFVFYAHSCCY